MGEPAVLILAAGKGTRMRSKLAKVLHPLAGLPMILHVVEAARGLNPSRVIVVIGHQRDRVADLLAAEEVELVTQERQLGTGDAVTSARNVLEDLSGPVLILPGDTPLLHPDLLRALITAHENAGAVATILTASLADPSGYGRIIRDEEGRLFRIVEEGDAYSEEREVREINTGIYCFETGPLLEVLGELSVDNVQGEYYLTDVMEIFRQQGRVVATHLTDAIDQVLGINDRRQLAQAERILRQRVRDALMEAGVTFLDPSSTLIDETVSIGPDTVIYPGVIIEGLSTVGAESVIGPHSWIVDSHIGRGVELRGWNYVNKTSVMNGVILQPFVCKGLE